MWNQKSAEQEMSHPHVCLCMYRNPLRRSQSFVLRDGVKGTFMSRGSQPNLVSYANDEADHASSSRDESRKKGGLMRNVSARPAVTALHSYMPHCHPGKIITDSTTPRVGLASHPYACGIAVCEGITARVHSSPLLRHMDKRIVSSCNDRERTDGGSRGCSGMTTVGTRRPIRG